MVLGSCLEETLFPRSPTNLNALGMRLGYQKTFVQVMRFVQILLFLNKKKKNDRQVYNKDVEC